MMMIRRAARGRISERTTDAASCTAAHGTGSALTAPAVRAGSTGDVVHFIAAGCAENVGEHATEQETEGGQAGADDADVKLDG